MNVRIFRLRIAAATFACAVSVLAGTATTTAQTVRVEVDPALGEVLRGRDGRLVLFLTRPDARVGRRARPADFFFPHDPQPLFAIDAAGDALLAGEVELGPDAPGFDGRRAARLGELPAGTYRAQVAWIHTRGDVGDFQLVRGNALSDPVSLQLAAGRTATLRLHRATHDRAFPAHVQGVEEFVVRSRRLSEHYGRDFELRAGVRLPRVLRPGTLYPAVYEVPGFGGDHGQVAWTVASSPSGSDQALLADHAFHIVLDPSSPNGHTLFLDSDNNGPWAQALVHELLPALEARYPLRPHAQARVLRGHSSGGWTVLHLALHFPELFSAAWSTAPDPVDFRHFQRIDLYRHVNAYQLPDGSETPSVRNRAGTVTMTVRQENLLEHVLGPNLTSAQQWASWQACFGSRRPDGSVRPLFDPLTGEIDRDEAERYRRFDLAHLLATQPQRYVPLWRERIRLIVGAADDFYLDEAVASLAAVLDALDPADPAAPTTRPVRPGTVRIVPGATHGSILRSREALAIPGEVVRHFRAAGVWPGP
ncbi:MAG: alpha/beta hydrolase-fold protein [Tepidisphaerales bacterium]